MVDCGCNWRNRSELLGGLVRCLQERDIRPMPAFMGTRPNENLDKRSAGERSLRQQRLPRIETAWQSCPSSSPLRSTGTKRPACNSTEPTLQVRGGQHAGCFHLCRRLQLHYSRRQLFPNAAIAASLVRLASRQIHSTEPGFCNF